jgi:deoxycytidylate deaminase
MESVYNIFMKKTQPIIYPYLPTGRSIGYVPADNQFMQAAKQFALEHSLDEAMPTGSIIVKDDQIVGRGANGSDYHQSHGCERVRLGIPTGQQYELCVGCHPKNHSEPRAIAAAAAAARGADLYLWGHWWCCQPCWNAIIAAGVNHVYLQEGSEVDFNKTRKPHASNR